jgi:probable rRNA maturation factor
MSPDGDLRPYHSRGRATVLFRATSSAPSISTARKRILKDFAKALSERLGGGKSLLCLITNDPKLRHLNQTFLGRDYATDVLSFPATGGSDGLGEIAISIERAAAQAAAFGHSWLDELRILMLHGTLHLCGFDHERDRGEMARAERKWRTAFNLPEGLIARNASRARRRLAQGASRKGALRA